MSQKAVLYRVISSEHVCPFGMKALNLLKEKNYEVEDNILKTASEIEAFKKKHKVKTTPQIFIENKRVGGFEDLQKYLGIKITDKSKVTYKPVIAIFSVTALMAMLISWYFFQALDWQIIVKYFVGLSMCFLAILKFQDLDSFSNQFITYDLLAKKWIRYAYIYPFAEVLVGLGMIGNIYVDYVAVIALLVGGIGAASVIKAVYIDKRELRCACVGGNSRVPLGFVSLSENLAMLLMGAWMLIGM